MIVLGVTYRRILDDNLWVSLGARRGCGGLGCSPGSGRLASASHMETRPHVAARGSYGFALASRALSAQAQRRVSRVSHVTAPRRGRSELRPPYSAYLRCGRRCFDFCKTLSSQTHGGRRAGALTLPRKITHTARALRPPYAALKRPASCCSAVRCEVRAPLARRQDEVKKAFWRKVPEARPSKKRGFCEHEAESARTGKCRVPLFRDPDLLSGPLVCPSK